MCGEVRSTILRTFAIRAGRSAGHPALRWFASGGGWDPFADAAVVGLGDGGGEVCQVAAGVGGLFEGCVGGTGVEVGIDLDDSLQQIETDRVAVADLGDGAADYGFRGTVNADGSAGYTGDTGV